MILEIKGAGLLQKTWYIERIETFQSPKPRGYYTGYNACDQETDPYVEGFPQQPWKLVKQTETKQSCLGPSRRR